MVDPVRKRLLELRRNRAAYIRPEFVFDEGVDPETYQHSGVEEEELTEDDEPLIHFSSVRTDPNRRRARRRGGRIVGDG